ncbi:MAG: hypothetical protein R3B70_47440 [Polyangiaceae bacterium]
MAARLEAVRRLRGSEGEVPGEADGGVLFALVSGWLLGAGALFEIVLVGG